MTEKTSENANQKRFQPDRFCKSMLSNILVARDFLEHNLPESLREITDLKTLALEEDSFIESEYQETSSDLLFSVDTEEGPAYLYLLLEYQSPPDDWIPLRLAKAQVNILKKYVETNPEAAELPLVCPILFYLGEEPYTGSMDFFDLFENPSHAREIFSEPFQVIHFEDIEEEDAVKEKNLSDVFQFFNKYLHARELLRSFEEAIVGYRAAKSRAEDLEKNRLEESEAKMRMDVAKRLLRLGVPLNRFIKALKLTAEEVKKLREKMH